jgi:hypothetical protein
VIARTSVAIAVVACAFATACTAYVAGQLKGLDDYPADGAVGNTASACSLIENKDANACNDCITQSCADDVTYACNGGSYKTWFYTMRQCAQNPAAGYEPGGNSPQYGCQDYNNPDAQPNTADDDPGHDRRALICIRDKCLAGGNLKPAPCRQCDLGITAPSGGTIVHLEDTACGKCIANACAGPIARCCGFSLNGDLPKCGYTDDPDFSNACHNLIARTDHLLPTDAGCDSNASDGGGACISNGCESSHCTEPTDTEQCLFDIHQCAQSCASSCP